MRASAMMSLGVLAISACTPMLRAEQAPFSATAALEFVRTHCVDCHQEGNTEGELDLSTFSGSGDLSASVAKWHKIADRVEAGEMPPADAEAPPAAARQEFVAWIRATIHAAICDDGIAPAPAQLRRLNRTEYANTVRDLLGIHINAGHALPADGAGGEGFDNAAEVLFLSPLHAETYLAAAQAALEHALKDPRARERLLIAEPNGETPARQVAEQILARFLRRAFRRPIEPVELQEYLRLFDSSYGEDEAFEPAVQLAMEAALVSPKFLFLWETPHDGDAPVRVAQHEFACRLSYFLWASMPDEELMQLADEGRLFDDLVLEEQVRRMLKSDTDRRGLRRGAKVREFAASFMEQWLGTRVLGREFQPDPKISRRYDSELEGGMKYEPVFFLEDLLADNRSLLNLLDSDFTYVNRRLARHYRVDGEFREQPKKVMLPEGSHRGGLLGMSAVLAVSSYPHRTSPVLRGKWILETLLGTPPPAPPPNVPPLEENDETAKPANLREKLEQHRSNPVCASCHSAIDPLGFGLENYDVLGRWREEVDGVPIDARGELPDGTEFRGPEELKQVLLARKQQFMRNFTTKMLGYALGRGLTNEDHCAIDPILSRLAEDDYRAQTLILEIVRSVPFQFKQGTVPGRPVSPEGDQVSKGQDDEGANR